MSFNFFSNEEEESKNKDDS